MPSERLVKQVSWKNVLQECCHCLLSELPPIEYVRSRASIPKRRSPADVPPRTAPRAPLQVQALRSSSAAAGVAQLGRAVHARRRGCLLAGLQALAAADAAWSRYYAPAAVSQEAAETQGRSLLDGLWGRATLVLA